MLYIIIYIYANVLNYILFESILTNILCMFYVPISICMIAESEINYYYYVNYISNKISNTILCSQNPKAVFIYHQFNLHRHQVVRDVK